MYLVWPIEAWPSLQLAEPRTHHKLSYTRAIAEASLWLPDVSDCPGLETPT